jgi:cystathionine beta-lyase
MTHANSPETDRLERGITTGLVRLSVGLEGTEVLLAHLERSLAPIEAVSSLDARSDAIESG